MYFAVLEYIPFGDMFTLWTFHGYFPEGLVRIYVAELAMVLGECMCHVMNKTTFCICENKGADQLRSNCEADQRLCFRYMDSKIPLLLKSEISSL